MAPHDYIKIELQEDIAFTKLNHHPNFVPGEFLVDVIPHSESHEYQRPSQIGCVCDEIANS